MRLKTEVNVSLRHYQQPVRYSLFTAILVFLPEIIFFLGGNMALYHKSIANFIETVATTYTDADLLDGDDDDNYFEAMGSESTTEEDKGDAVFGGTDRVVFFGSDSVSIWGNVLNQDSTTINENGVVIFYGEEWTNDFNGNLDSDGLLCLTSPRPAPYAASFQQIIDNGGRTASFPDVIIDNPNNVYMLNDMVVEDTLFFMRGKLVLDGHNLYINNPHPDAIQGYDEDKYVVTGAASAGGYLVRAGIGKPEIVFPIGTDTSSYTPASISNRGTVDNYSMRVFGGVFQHGDSGVDHSADAVGKTWEIKEDSTGGSNLTLSFQHNQSEEGGSFNPSNHFVTRYDGAINNTSGDTVSSTEWDLVTFDKAGSGSTDGYLTSGAAISGAIVSTRSGITAVGYFTKASYNSVGVLPVELLYFDAFAEETYNTLKWSTAMEIDNYYFTVDRSSDGENFEELERIPGAGNTTEKMDYKYEDLQPFEITYYRLKQTDYDGTEEVLGIQVVRRDEIGARELVVYPNPCRETYLKVELPQEITEDAYVEILNMSGQSVVKMDLDPYGFDSVAKLRVDGLPRGMYLVQLKNNNTIRTKKFIIPER